MRTERDKLHEEWADLLTGFFIGEAAKMLKMSTDSMVAHMPAKLQKGGYNTEYVAEKLLARVGGVFKYVPEESAYLFVTKAALAEIETY